jgi:hypothetical protein
VRSRLLLFLFALLLSIAVLAASSGFPEAAESTAQLLNLA